MPAPTYASELRATALQEHGEDLYAETLCHRCHRPILADEANPDDPEQHDECHGQTIEENLLDAAVERVAGELAEVIDEYEGCRVPEAESATTTEQVAVLREALRLLRSTLCLCPAAGEAEQPGNAAEQLRVLLSAAVKG